MRVHKVSYRQTSGLIERLDIAKMMLLEEFGKTAKYANKKLEDIELRKRCGTLFRKRNKSFISE